MTIAARPIVEAAAGGSVESEKSSRWFHGATLTHADDVTLDVGAVGEITSNSHQEVDEACTANASCYNCGGSEVRVVLDLIQD